MTMNGKPKYEGEFVTIGGVEYLMPSLGVAQAKKFWPMIVEINNGVTVENLPEKYDKIIQIIHAALSRNYPDVTLEELNEHVDLRNIRKLQLLVMGTSGVGVTPGVLPVAEKPVG